MRHQHNFDPLAGALPDEYFFIVLAMTVTGAVAVGAGTAYFPIAVTIPIWSLFQSRCETFFLRTWQPFFS